MLLLKFFDAIGKMVFRLDGVELSGNSELTLNLAEQHNGVYFVKMSSTDYQVYKKIVIRH